MDKEYTQEELKEFFNYQMNESEQAELKKLVLDDEIMLKQKPTYKIKFIESVGYVFVGEGYLILDDGSEPTHYFAKIYTEAEEAKKEIINK